MTRLSIQGVIALACMTALTVSALAHKGHGRDRYERRLAELRQASPEEVFEQIGGHWIKHYKAGDLESLMALYTDDARVMLHEQPALVGKEAIRGYFETTMGKNDVDFQIDVERAEIIGDVAYLISKYWMTVTPPNGVEPWRDAGRSLLIYKKSDDGKWLIHADIDQSTPDVTWPAPSE